MTLSRDAVVNDNILPVLASIHTAVDDVQNLADAAVQGVQVRLYQNGGDGVMGEGVPHHL